MRDAYINGDFVHLEGGVHPNYDPSGDSVHDIEADPKRPTFGLLDFGFQRAYFGVLQDVANLASDDGVGECLVDEHPGCDVPEAVHARQCAELLKARGLVMLDCYCDPAGNARNTQTGLSSIRIYEDAFRAQGVLSGRMLWTTNPVDRHIPNGVEAVNSKLEDHLGIRRLFVARGLTERKYGAGVQGIHLGLLGLHYKKGSTDGRIVHDASSHPTDALRYYVINRHGVMAQPDADAHYQAGSADAGEPEWSVMDGDF
jgi:hypothetical protein